MMAMIVHGRTISQWLRSQDALDIARPNPNTFQARDRAQKRFRVEMGHHTIHVDKAQL